MKTKLLIMLIGIFVIGSVVAGLGISAINRNIDLDKDTRDTLIARGFTDITYEDFEIGDDQVKRTMYQKDVIDTFVIVDTYYMECSENETLEIEDREPNCKTWERIDYTNNEIEAMLNTRVQTRLELISEDVETTTTKVGEGDLITRERR